MPLKQTAPAAHRGGLWTACPHLIPAQHTYFWQTTGNCGTAKLWGLKYRISAHIPGNYRYHVSPAAGKTGTPSERAVRKAIRD